MTILMASVPTEKVEKKVSPVSRGRSTYHILILSFVLISTFLHVSRVEISYTVKLLLYCQKWLYFSQF